MILYNGKLQISQLSLRNLAGRLLKVFDFFELRFLISNSISFTLISWNITISTISLIFIILGCLAYFLIAAVCYRITNSFNILQYSNIQTLIFNILTSLSKKVLATSESRVITFIQTLI